jgi:hypothetical protein
LAEEELEKFYKMAIKMTTTPVETEPDTVALSVTSVQHGNSVHKAMIDTSIETQQELVCDLTRTIPQSVECNQVYTKIEYIIPQQLSMLMGEPIWFNPQRLQFHMPRIQNSCRNVKAICQLKHSGIRDESNPEVVSQWLMDHEDEFTFGDSPNLNGILFHVPPITRKPKFVLPAYLLDTFINEVDMSMNKSHDENQIVAWISDNYWWIATHRSKPTGQHVVKHWNELCSVEQVRRIRRSHPTTKKFPWDPDRDLKKSK